ncbi:MAG: hypothetical protein IJC43_01020 [Clostridia bacterium]|nr:hypothetical protein [Clostridia bacterium]
MIYRLTTEWIEASGEPIYGVEIEAEPTGECVTLSALSTDGQRVETLLAALMRGAVTPLTAADVVYDWLISEEGSRIPVESR